MGYTAMEFSTTCFFSLIKQQIKPMKDKVIKTYLSKQIIQFTTYTYYVTILLLRFGLSKKILIVILLFI
jgi:ferritin-like protein